MYMKQLLERTIQFITQRPSQGQFTGCYGNGTGGPCRPKCDRCILLEDLRKMVEGDGLGKQNKVEASRCALCGRDLRLLHCPNCGTSRC